MKKSEFDSYKFGVNTHVKWDDEWYKVHGVDFPDRIILIAGVWVNYTEIEEIEEIPPPANTGEK